MIKKSFGFIISRHVNSEKTDKYWKHSIRLLRRLYPYVKIVVIDDNSDTNFLTELSDNLKNNVEIVQSVINEIRGINTLSELERFCEAWGLNEENTNPMSFPALVAEAYKD